MTNPQDNNTIKLTLEISDRPGKTVWERPIPFTNYLTYDQMKEILDEMSRAFLNYWMDLKHRRDIKP